MAGRCRPSAKVPLAPWCGAFRLYLQMAPHGAPGDWGVTPQGSDGDFGPNTKASVEAFQAWGSVAVDGVVADQTWSVSLHAASATLETAVGPNFVIG
jgi:hypothetical protein